jgi:transketolase
MGVGMAIAERFLSNCFNFPDLPIVDHHVYSIVSDGDLMEGISSEAASLAGYLGLGKLVYLYDDNHISIEGETDITFTEDIRRRFEAYGWHVLRVDDGNDLGLIGAAIEEGKAEDKRPSLIMVRTHIGYGSPKQDTAAAHGEPLGEDAVRQTKEALGWVTTRPFHLPEEASNHFLESMARGLEAEAEWTSLLERYREAQPDMAARFERVVAGDLPSDLGESIPTFEVAEGPVATRSASGKVMNALASKLPHSLAGGSADLGPSTKTLLIGYGDFGFSQDCSHNVHFGVREHAMGAIVNGMALHGGIIPYGATFLIFSDYMRPALRLSALMSVHSIFVFTHDSVGLGEDGPTHQPVEHLMSLRAMPGMTVIRPADANETALAWRIAIEGNGPVSLALTRQNLPILDTGTYAVKEGVRRGAYILAEPSSSDPDLVIIATGSEVHLALKAREELAKGGVAARVVSMPSWEIFEKQAAEYRVKVLPPGVPKVAVEAGSTLGWHKWVGDSGAVVGLDRFGASAPGKIALERLGFNVENVVERSLRLLKGNGD